MKRSLSVPLSSEAHEAGSPTLYSRTYREDVRERSPLHTHSPEGRETNEVVTKRMETMRQMSICLSINIILIFFNLGKEVILLIFM